MLELANLLQVVLGGNKAIFICYQYIFIKTIDFDPLEASFDELVAVLNKYGKADDWLIEMANPDLTQFIFTEITEPTIGIKQPQFIYDFSIVQAH